ncbi:MULTISPECIES: lytic transglycosylase domain-containing protein [unclassified Roseitalea]|uniref:lytic transglycosylase domain-containing protein n=1 Tax=unclassified Roseitalea TaxID=2639107 RepID=UPI00273F12A6|nr:MULTISPECIES: lytic transglycosylase domain-containing protein [unclassified Roseitalea]
MKTKFRFAPVLLCTIALSACQSADAGLLSAFAAGQDNTTASTFALKASNPLSASKDRRPFADLIAKHARKNGVPVDLAHAVVYSESSYRADARGAAGEIGLMQLRLATARGMGYKGSAKGLYDPETNIKYGMKYLGGAHELAGGSTCGTILRYNAGHAARSMNPISQRYCNKVARLLEG